MSYISQDFLLKVAMGHFSNISPWVKTGYNADIDTGSEHLWIVGGLYEWPVAEQQMELISSSEEDDIEKADTNPGTGVHVVTLYYLDDDGVEKTEDVTLNGTTAVTTTAEDIFRVQNLRTKTVGSGGKAAGNIDIRHLDDTPIYSRIEAGCNRARNSAWRVPAGKTLYVTSVAFGVVGTNRNNAYAVRFRTQARYDNVAAAITTHFNAYTEILLEDAHFQKELEIPTKLPAGVDINVLGTAYSDNCICSSQLRGFLVTE